MRALLPADVEPAVLGGSVLASGGGGWVAHGRLVGETATRLGVPRLAGIDEIPGDGIVDHRYRHWRTGRPRLADAAGGLRTRGAAAAGGSR